MLFGLGLGLVLAGLAMVFFPPSQPDETEIIARARDLGMVFRDEVVAFTPTPPSGTVENTGNSSDLAAVAATAGRTGKNDEKPVSLSQAAATTDGQVYQKKDGQFARVIIPRGSILTEVAVILKNAGVVDHDLFLERAKERKVSQKIIAGVYRLPLGGDVDEIIDIITTQ